MHALNIIKRRRAKTSHFGAPAALALTSAALFAGAAFAMPHGRAGDCFEEVRGRGVYKTVTETAPQSPLVTYRRTAAVYREEAQTIVVRPARRVYETAPAVYRTVAQTRLVPGPVRRVSVAAAYRTVEERQVIEPAHLEWRRSEARGGYAADGQTGLTATPTGEVLCRILVPARISVACHQVMIAPASVREIQGRARRVICYVKVLDRPCRRISHMVPAVTRTVMVKRLVKAAQCEKIVTPRPAKTVQRRVRVGDGPKGWRRLGCAATHGARRALAPSEAWLGPGPGAPEPGPAPTPPSTTPAAPTRP